MESRYYYFDGQNPDNTKISDRSHALHITRENWNKIRDHMKRNERARQEREKDESNKRYLKEGSDAMKKNWANSLENIRKRKEEEKVKAIEEEKKHRHEKFLARKAAQAEKRRIFVEKAKKSNFLLSGTAKMLSSAYQEGEVVLERQKQIEFKKMLRKMEEEDEAKEAEKIKQDAIAYKDEMLREKINEKQKRQEWGQYMRQFLEEKARKEAEEKKKRLKKEEADWEEALNEMRCMETVDKEKVYAKKELIKRHLNNQKERLRVARALKETEDRELDECVKAYRETKQRIQCLTRQREKELQEEAIKRRMDATIGTFENEAKMAKEREEREEASYQKALAEREVVYQERMKRRQELKEKDAKDKIEDMQKFLKDDEKRRKEQDEKMKWEKLNDHKTTEVLQHMELQKKIKKFEERKKYGQDLIQQMNERKERERHEMEKDEAISKAIAVTDDENFFALADEVMKHAVENGRITKPIESAILEYKKINILDYERQPKDDTARCEDYMKGMYGYTKNFVTKANRIKNPYRRCKCQQEM